MKVLSCSELDNSTIENIAGYWSEASDEHLTKMGVDLTKRPTYAGVVAMLEQQIALPYAEKKGIGDRLVCESNSDWALQCEQCSFWRRGVYASPYLET